MFFLGRKNEIINVGGSKVYPAEIEENLRAVPGVLNVRVFANKSSIAGQLVGAEVVADPMFSRAEVRDAILKRCAEKLASYKHPRLLRFVSRIEETDSQKILRAEAQNK